MNRTKDELLLECIKQFEHIENVLGYNRLATTRSLINEINQALRIHDVVGQSEQLVCDNHKPDLEHFMKYSESICKKCKQKV